MHQNPQQMLNALYDATRKARLVAEDHETLLGYYRQVSAALSAPTQAQPQTPQGLQPVNIFAPEPEKSPEPKPEPQTKTVITHKRHKPAIKAEKPAEPEPQLEDELPEPEDT